MEKISVIVNNYNYADYVGEAIQSCISQNYNNLEVIVVDDGSTDESREVIDTYKDQIIPIYQSNQGQGGAFNSGFARSSGDIIIFLDSDDKLLPGMVDEIYTYFKDSTIGMLQWSLQIINKQSQPTGEVISKSTVVSFRESLINFGPASYKIPPTSGNAWRRSVLEEVLPLPTEDFRYDADSYLFSLAPLYGQNLYINKTLSQYRIHGLNYSRSYSSNPRWLYERYVRYNLRVDLLDKELNKLLIGHDIDRWKAKNWHFYLIQAVLTRTQYKSKLLNHKTPRLKYYSNSILNIAKWLCIIFLVSFIHILPSKIGLRLTLMVISRHE